MFGCSGNDMIGGVAFHAEGSWRDGMVPENQSEILPTNSREIKWQGIHPVAAGHGHVGGTILAAGNRAERPLCPIRNASAVYFSPRWITLIPFHFFLAPYSCESRTLMKMTTAGEISCVFDAESAKPLLSIGHPQDS